MTTGADKLPDLESHPDIYLGVCGRFHAFNLAAEYAKMGRLGGLYAADHHLRPPKGVARSRYFNRWDLKCWRLLAARSSLSFGYTIPRESAAFDRWLGQKLKHVRGGIFHGWNTHVSLTLQRLDPSRWLRCIERSCPHNLFQRDLLLEESSRLDIPFTDNAEIEAAVQELYDADVIVTPSRYSASTYRDPVLQAKVRINPLGANYPYLEKMRQAGAPLRVLLVGNRFLRKGTHYLIEAFKQIDDPSAELWIRGEVPEEYRRRVTDRRIRIFPPLSANSLRHLYENATLFCLPSVDEGFGMVALEALSFGLPLIYTDHCGVADLLTKKVGIQVRIRSSEEIRNAISELMQWAGARWEEFDCERARILKTHSWEACAARMIETVYLRPEGHISRKAAPKN